MEDLCVISAAEEEKLLGVAILLHRGKSKGRNLQGAMPLGAASAGEWGWLRTPEARKHSRRSAEACSRNAGSGSPVPVEACWG